MPMTKQEREVHNDLIVALKLALSMAKTMDYLECIRYASEAPRRAVWLLGQTTEGGKG